MGPGVQLLPIPAGPKPSSHHGHLGLSPSSVSGWLFLRLPHSRHRELELVGCPSSDKQFLLQMADLASIL
jgi:hypothetical protein